MNNPRISSFETASPCFDRFEVAWKNAPYPNLRKWLSSKDVSSNPDISLELCAIDLEWRWRVYAESKMSGKRVRSEFPRLPVADDYRTLLGDYWNLGELKQRLLIVEWGVRNLWGDRPDTDAFQHRFPDDDEHWQIKLESHLDSLLPLDMSVQKGGEVVISIQVPAHFQIGRQKREEPPSPAWISSTNRLLVANCDVREISREQVQVRRTRRGELELKNASGSFNVRLDLEVLHANQVSRFTLPIALRFSDILVSFSEALSKC